MQPELDVLDGLGRMGLAKDRPWYRSDLRQRVHAIAEKRSGLADPPPHAMRERACEVYEAMVLYLGTRDGLIVNMIGPPPTRKQVRSMKKAEVHDGRRGSYSLSSPEVERLERTRREVIVNSVNGVSASWTNRMIGPAIELTLSLTTRSPEIEPADSSRFGIFPIPDSFVEYNQLTTGEILQRCLNGLPLVRTWTCPWKE